jgi:hypothetical protein
MKPAGFTALAAERRPQEMDATVAEEWRAALDERLSA